MGTELVSAKHGIRGSCVRDSYCLGANLLRKANGPGRENQRKGMTAFPSKADIRLNFRKRSANDPKRTSRFSAETSLIML